MEYLNWDDIDKVAPTTGHKTVLRYDYGVLDFIYPPDSQEELTHKYSVLRRTLIGDNIQKPDSDSKSLREYVQCFRDGVKDSRDSIQKGTGLNIRYMLTPILSLLPLLIFKRRRPRRILYSYAMFSYFLCPEPWRALYNAK